MIKLLDILLENGCNNITILHCSSVYPTKYYNANLNFINTMNLTGLSL